MEISKRTILLTLRIVLTALCVLAVGFIIYNALQPAVKSAGQSGATVSLLQRVVACFAPNSAFVTATGEEYERAHAVVRGIAHFAEYALLGTLGGWCYFSYTRVRKWLAVPVAGVAFLAVLDEILQKFVAGRGAQFLDVCIDLAGGYFGIGFAILTVWLGFKIVRGYRKNREEQS